jgi:hypothetical protein
MNSAAALRSQVQSALGDRFDVNFTLHQRPVPETLPAGIAAIDALTGGIPRGCFTEVFGPASSGRTALLISLLAQATARQEFCALIDATDAFDPASAVQAGVRLPQILWVRCGGDAENALKVTDLIVQAGGFGLVIMDLADTPPRMARRISLASWFRLRRAVERTPTVLLVLEQQINAKSCSSLQLEMRREKAAWSGRDSGQLLQAMSVHVEDRKHNRCRAAQFDTSR